MSGTEIAVIIFAWVVLIARIVVLNYVIHMNDDVVRIEWLEWNDNMKPYKEVYCTQFNKNIMTYYPYFKKPIKTYSRPFRENDVIYVYVYDHERYTENKITLEKVSDCVMEENKDDDIS